MSGLSPFAGSGLLGAFGPNPNWEPEPTISDVIQRLESLELRLTQLLELPPEGVAFLRAAIEAPRDRDLWLVLVDWLQEQGKDAAAQKLRDLQ